MSDGEAGILRAERGRVLVVDDDVDVCALLEARLAGRGFEVAWTTSATAALDSLATADVDAVLTDIKMARMSGLELCERIVASRPDLPAVLVTGESGTGKELVARALHRRGRRSAGPFVALNCAALPEGLLESELFGHARGAFTHAHNARAGLFQQAHGGTIFLDEIADLPPSLQPRLLRVIQERSVRPVGADHEVPVDVRIVAATNRDLEAAVEEGRLREDLYFRLNVIRVELPPLRVRGRDILLLAQRFVGHYARQMTKPVCGLSPAVAERLLAYAWPGNVRELQNCMERAVALAAGERVGVDDLPESIRTYRPAQVVIAGDDPEELVTLEEGGGRCMRR